MNAKDVMSRRVVTLSPDATIGAAAKLFERSGITGAPVVAADGRLLGVLSQTDLVRHSVRFAAGAVPPFYLEGGQIRLTRIVDTPENHKVVEAMTPAVYTARDDTPVGRLAGFMRAKRIHRVLITRDGKLVGVVTTMDLLALIARGGDVSLRRRGRRRSMGAPGRRTASPPKRGRRRVLSGL